jgi:hypothetical protein
MSNQPHPEFELKEVLVCIVLAFCIAAGSVTANQRQPKAADRFCMRALVLACFDP